MQTAKGYQAFPQDTWAQEFAEAKRRGLEHIEWVVDSFDPIKNPILLNPLEVQQVVDKTGVKVRSLCADFLMDNPLVPSGASWNIFLEVLRVSRDVGIEVVVVPAVDQFSARIPSNLEKLKIALKRLSQEIGDLSPSIALETDLPPHDYLELLDDVGWESISINYDSGNSASLGFDAQDEILTYGNWISDIHVKDRKLSGPSVELGEGDADLDFVLEFAHESRFAGIVTMQAFRDIEGLATLDRQLNFLEKKIGLISDSE